MGPRSWVMSSPRQDAQKTALSLVHSLNKGVCGQWREGAKEVTGLPSLLTRAGSALLPLRVMGLWAGPEDGEGWRKDGKGMERPFGNTGNSQDSFLSVSSFEGSLTMPPPLWAESVPDLNPDHIGLPLLLVFLLFASKPHLLPSSLRKGGVCCLCLSGWQAGTSLSWLKSTL